MQTEKVNCPSSEDIEAYCRQVLTPEQIEEVEIHLLICERCQDRVEETDRFLAAMAKGAKKVRDEEASDRKGWSTGGWRLIAAGFVLMLAVAGTWRLYPLRNEHPYAVALVSERAAEADRVVTGPSDRPWMVSIEKEGLAASDSYRLRVVSLTGSEIWSGQLNDGRSLTATMERPLSPGQYLFQLYASDETLLREFVATAK